MGPGREIADPGLSCDRPGRPVPNLWSACTGIHPRRESGPRASRPRPTSASIHSHVRSRLMTNHFSPPVGGTAAFTFAIGTAVRRQSSAAGRSSRYKIPANGRKTGPTLSILRKKGTSARRRRSMENRRASMPRGCNPVFQSTANSKAAPAGELLLNFRQCCYKRDTSCSWSVPRNIAAVAAATSATCSTMVPSRPASAIASMDCRSFSGRPDCPRGLTPRWTIQIRIADRLRCRQIPFA